MTWALIAAMFLDLAITVHAVGKGVIEANPLAQEVPAMFLLKALSCLFFIYLHYRIGHIGLYRKVLNIVVVLYILIITNNIWGTL